MRAAFDIALKDLRQRIRDRSALLIGIVAPFTLAVLFAVMLGGVDDGFHADWVVADLDGGEVARGLLEGPIAGIEDAGIVSLRQVPGVAEARAAVDEGSAHTAIIIPAGFSDAVTRGSGAGVQVIGDPDASISTQVAQSVLRGFANQVDAVGISVATALFAAREVVSDATTAELARQARALPAPIEIVADATADRTASTATYYAAAMAILFVFLGAQFGVVSLLAEKRNRTLSRMLAAPLRPASIIAGKTLVSLILGVVSMSIIVIGTSLLLGARWGDPMAIGLLIFSAAIAATGVALLAVGFARTEDQAGSLVAIVTISLAVLGGSFFPVAQGHGLIAQLSVITPHAWFLRGVADVSSGGGVVTAAGPVLVLLTIGAVSGGVGLLRTRRVVIG